jgi:alpha-acetolactate decarboxylase
VDKWFPTFRRHMSPSYLTVQDARRITWTRQIPEDRNPRLRRYESLKTAPSFKFLRRYGKGIGKWKPTLTVHKQTSNTS